MKAERHPYLLLAAIIVLWGANWPIMKIGLNHIPPIWFAAARLLLGSLCLFILIGLRGQLSRPARGDLPVLISVSVLQLGLGMMFMNLGLMTVDAGRSAILAYTTSLWVAPLAVFVLGEKINLAKGLGIALGLAGVAVLFNPVDFNFSDPDQLIGNGYLIASAMIMAIVITHIRHHKMVMPPLQIMPWQMFFGGLIVTSCAFYFEGMPDLEASPTLIAILAYNGPIASAFCFWAYQTVMRVLPATSTSLGSLGIPVAGMIFSAIALGESLTFGKLTGLGLISSGVGILIVGDLFLKSRRRTEDQK